MKQIHFPRILCVAFLIVLAACQAPPAAADPTAIPQTAVPPTAVPTITPAQAGTIYSPKTFDLPITFLYGPEWILEPENASQVSLTIKDSDEYFSFIDLKSVKIASPAAPYSAVAFPDDFVNWIQAHGLFQVVKTESVFVGGLPGTQIDVETTADCGTGQNFLFAGSGGWKCWPGLYYRFVYMDDVNGERLLIMIEGYSDEDFASKVDAAQKVLDTVVFSKP